MKTVKFFLALSFVACVITYSCKEDENEENKANLTGYWENTLSEITDCLDEGADSVFCENGPCLTYLFNSDGTFVRSFHTQSDTGTYSVENDKMVLCTTLEMEEEGEIVETDTCQTYSFIVSETVLRIIENDPENSCRYNEVFAKVLSGPPAEEEEN